MPAETKASTALDQESLQNLADDLIKRVLAEGADAADVLLVSGTSQSASCRLGEVEEVERAEAQDLGLRAFSGRQQAIVSSSDFSKSTLDELVNRVVAMAKAAPADPYCGLADPEFLATEFPDLDIFDSDSVKTERTVRRHPDRRTIKSVSSLVCRWERRGTWQGI